MKLKGYIPRHFVASSLCAVLCIAALLSATSQPAPAGVIEAWVQHYNGPGNENDQGHAVAVDSNGDVVVTGISFANGGYDFYTAKYAGASGTLLWENRYDGTYNGNDQSYSVALDGSGNVVVTGFTSDYAGVGIDYSSMDYYTAKYAGADGRLLWENRYDGTGSQYDQARGLAIDGSGNVIVTGVSYSHEGGNDYYTAKYAAGDGTLIWEKRYDGPGNDSDEALDVAVDRDGNVIVTGNSLSESGGNWDYHTVKYAASNGALLWGKSYNGRANANDTVRAVAVDRSGNVIVTGQSNNGRDDDYVTIKYAARNGARLWQKRYNSPDRIHDQPTAMVLDSKGNVIVTGNSFGIVGSGYDYTVKYKAAGGTVIWEKGGSIAEARAVAVDSNNNVAVAGYSSGRYVDLLVAKYAETDGLLLWEKRYNGPANGNDYPTSPRSLAVGSNGMVVVTGGSAPPDLNSDYVTVVYREVLPVVTTRLVSAGTNRPPGSAFYRARTP